MNEVIIKWRDVYSDTMEPDKHGRWARKAMLGDFENVIVDGKSAIFEIAWIKIIETKFVISLLFPDHHNNYVFDTLEEAMKEVENKFNFFMSCCIK